MRMRIAAAAGVAAASLLVGLPAGAQSFPGTLTVSPTGAPVGGTFTASGDFCDGGVAWVFLTGPDIEDPIVLSGDGSVVADDDGVWTASFTVPELDPSFEWQVDARCWVGELVYDYGPTPFDVFTDGEGPPAEPPVDRAPPTGTPADPAAPTIDPAVAAVAAPAVAVVADPDYTG